MDDVSLLTLEEAARKSRLHLDTMRRYVREGRIAARKVGKRYLVSEADLRMFLDSDMVQAQKPTAPKGE